MRIDKPEQKRFDCEAAELQTFRGEFIPARDVLPDQRRRRGNSKPAARVAAIASDCTHAACPPTRCPGCGGTIIEAPCRLCEIRSLKYARPSLPKAA